MFYGTNVNDEKEILRKEAISGKAGFTRVLFSGQIESLVFVKRKNRRTRRNGPSEQGREPTTNSTHI